MPITDLEVAATTASITGKKARDNAKRLDDLEARVEQLAVIVEAMALDITPRETL